MKRTAVPDVAAVCCATQRAGRCCRTETELTYHIQRALHISTDWCAARGRRWIKVQLVARVSEQLGNSEVPQRSHTRRLYQAKVAVGCLHHNEINISPFATRQEKFASMWVLQEFSSFKMQVLPGAGERTLTHVGPRQTEKAFIGTTRTPPDTSAHF